MTRPQPIDIADYVRGNRKGKRAKPSHVSGEQSTQSVSLHLPWPPSVNTYWRSFNGRNILSEQGRKYKEAAGYALVAAGKPEFRGKCMVSIALYPPDNRRRDCDNTLKPILDCLVAGGVIESDDYRIVRGIVVNWSDDAASKATARVHVVIVPMKKGPTP